jgi:HPt (histidine-containing phosphotransfer) domain-containing protein
MTTNAIDHDTFVALRDTTGAEFVRELVDTFLQEAPGMLGDLRESLATDDADRFRRAAHSLKSNANTFGALGLGAMAKALELAGLDRVLAMDPEPVAAVEQEYARVAAALEALRHA